MSTSKYYNNISCKCRILIEVIVKICRKYKYYWEKCKFKTWKEKLDLINVYVLLYYILFNTY